MSSSGAEKPGFMQKMPEGNSGIF